MFFKKQKRDLFHQLKGQLPASFVLQTNISNKKELILKNEELSLFYIFISRKFISYQCKTILHSDCSKKIYFYPKRFFPMLSKTQSCFIKKYFYFQDSQGKLIVFDEQKIRSGRKKPFSRQLLAINISKPYISKNGEWGIEGDLQHRQTKRLLEESGSRRIEKEFKLESVIKFLAQSIYTQLLKKLDSS